MMSRKNKIISACNLKDKRYFFQTSFKTTIEDLFVKEKDRIQNASIGLKSDNSDIGSCWVFR